MTKWKSDPILVRIFEEIQALWMELGTTRRPILLRVEQRASNSNWNGSSVDGNLLNTWLFDDHGARLAPVLRREPHIFGETHGEFSEYGLVKFAIESARDRLVLEFRLGPNIGGEIHYEVEEQDGIVRLLANSGSLA